MFKNKKIGVWGLGVVGQSIIRFFNSLGIQVSCLDKKAPSLQQQKLLENTGTTFCLQTDETLSDFLHSNDYIVPSPGIDLYPFKHLEHKWLSELDIFHYHWKKPIIAVTGSVGKTTVTHVLSHLLEQAGKKIATGGNIGLAMLDLLSQQDQSDYAVLEVSSFQLEISKQFAPTLALWTNFYPNHLDRHGSMQNYFLAKLSMIKNQRTSQHAILPVDLFPLIEKHPELQSTLYWYSTQNVSFNNCYCIENNAIIFKDSFGKKNIYSLDDLPDQSFFENWLLIIAALDMLHVSTQQLALKEDNAITIPEHRLEFVTVIKDAYFYNDSKSSLAASTLSALEKFKGKPIVLFVGGISKGVDRTDFIKNLKGKIKSLYCFGKEAEYLNAVAQQSQINSYAYDTLEDALGHYMNNCIAQQDRVLFSPAGASFDLFANYQERGTYFKNLVNDYAMKYKQ